MTNLTILDVARNVLNIPVLYVLLVLLGIVLAIIVYEIVKVIKAHRVQRLTNEKFVPLAMLGSGLSVKLIIYLFAFAMIVATAFGLYHKITETTTSNTYTNQVSKVTGAVDIDQRQILPEKKYLLRFEVLGLDIHFFDVTPMSPVVMKNEIKTTPVAPVVPVTNQPIKKATHILGTVLKSILGLGIVIVATHYVVKIIKQNKTTKPSGV